MKIETLIKNIPNLRQVQYSMIDQLFQLVKVAYKLELMNAYNYLVTLTKFHKNMVIDTQINDIINGWEVVDVENIHRSSLKDQCILLIGIAAKLGLYDAQDFLKDEMY